MQILKEFKEFAIKGNALDLAIGVVIGAAFGQVINSLVNDIISPLLSLLTGHVNFGNLQFTIFGQVMHYGLFLNTLINFLIVAFGIFLLVKQINRFRTKEEIKEEAKTKNCQYCFSSIPIQAKRCPNCTSQLA